MVAYGKYNDGEMRDVIPTDEEFMIASDVERIVNGK